VEEELSRNATAQRKIAAELSEELKKARAEARRLEDMLLKVEGEITKAKGAFAHFAKALKELEGEYEKRSEAVAGEVSVQKAKLANVTGKIEKIRAQQKPMEAALGPMLKK